MIMVMDGNNPPVAMVVMTDDDLTERNKIMCTAGGAYATGLDSGTPALTRGWKQACDADLRELLDDIETRTARLTARADALAMLAEQLEREIEAREYDASDPSYQPGWDGRVSSYGIGMGG